jgi:hypothetical protein
MDICDSLVHYVQRLEKVEHGKDEVKHDRSTFFNYKLWTIILILCFTNLFETQYNYKICGIQKSLLFKFKAYVWNIVKAHFHKHICRRSSNTV